MNDSKKSEEVEKLRQLMNIAGIDTDKYSISIKENKKREALPPTVMLFQTFSSLAASELSPAACKVLFFFFAQTQYQNVISMDQFTIATHVNITERTVRKAISELIKYGIITKVQLINDKRRNEYFLNPYSSWKGSSMQRNELISEMDPNQLTMFGRDAKQLKAAEKKLFKESN